MSDGLSPENRKLLCSRIGEEVGIDGELLDRVLEPNTVSGLNEFRDACIKLRKQEEVRKGFYTPRCYQDGSARPEVDEVRTPLQSFIELMTDMGL